MEAVAHLQTYSSSRRPRPPPRPPPPPRAPPAPPPIQLSWHVKITEFCLRMHRSCYLLEPRRRLLATSWRSSNASNSLRVALEIAEYRQEVRPRQSRYFSFPTRSSTLSISITHPLHSSVIKVRASSSLSRMDMVTLSCRARLLPWPCASPSAIGNPPTSLVRLRPAWHVANSR